MFPGIKWLDRSRGMESELNGRREPRMRSWWRWLGAHMLWEQGVVGSNPIAPTSNLSTGNLFVVGIFVSRPRGANSAVERRLPQIPADNSPLRIRISVYAFSTPADGPMLAITPGPHDLLLPNRIMLAHWDQDQYHSTLWHPRNLR